MEKRKGVQAEKGGKKKKKKKKTGGWRNEKGGKEGNQVAIFSPDL